MRLKKICVVFFSLLIASGSLVADEFGSDAFLGVEFGYGELQGDIGGILATPNFKGTGAGYGLRAGAQNADWRTVLSLYFFTKGKQDFKMLNIGVDYRFAHDSESSVASTFDPYVGLNMGYGNYQSTGINANGFMYGAEAGVVISVLNSLDVDFGYRYSLSTIKPFDHMGSAIVAFNYFY